MPRFNRWSEENHLNKMGDPLPLRLALPELRYPIGSEPEKTISINQHSIIAYIKTVKEILGNDEFNRIRGTFLGPVIKLGERSLKLSAKIVHAVLTKSIKTVKRHEAWFHFGAQPMRFSIREFHMVTGLKCSGEAREPREETERFKWDFLKGRTHTVKDVEKQLRNTREDASDERFCLAMLLLIESILLQKSLLDGGTTFTLDYVKIAQDMDVLMTYPWGRTAYNLLLKSLQRAVDKSLDKNNYDLQGFPMAFLIWILESVPLLQYAFSQVVPILSVQPSTPIFLCEKYLQIASPQLIDVLLIEIKDHLKVTCILPPIPNDPEADVCMEDEANKDLDDMADLSKRGYKFKIRDWGNMSVDLYGANEQRRRASLLFGNGGMSQASSSYQEESLESKINRISEMVGDNLRIMNDRLCLIEKDRKQIKERVTKLEKLQRVTSYETLNNETDTAPFHETASRQGEPNTDQADEQLNNEASIILKTDTREPMNEITKETPGSPIAQQNIETPVLTPIQTQQETHELMNENISPNISDTQPNTRARRNLLTEQNKDVESRVQNPFEIGANVEISSQDDNTCHKWYPGNVLATYLVCGVEMVKVEYSAPSLDEKKRKRSVQTRVSIDRIRPQPPPERPGAKKSYELMDDVEAFDNGAWCAGKVKVILFDGTCFVSLNNSTEQIYFNHSEMRKPRKWIVGVWKMTEKMEEEQTQSVNPSEGDGDKKGKAKAVACKKKEAAANAQPVDLLPFLQREENRPIRPRNPPMPVTPEVILPIDPFVTPEFPRFSRLAHCMDLRGIYRVPFYINGREIEKEFFQKMDDAENNLNKEHINVAFEMLNCKRVEQGAWFRNNNLPAACFVPVRFLEVVGYAYESVRKPHKKKQTLLEGCVGELVKGLIHPKKVWLEDVDVIYGVIEDMLSYHYIGVEIQLMDNTITLFHCGLPKANIKRALNQIQELAVLISAIKMELLGEEVNFEDISPFQVKFAEGLPKTKFPYNCGIFVVKMLE
ncbi:unnamed protein product [Brassica rapa]|uniref:Ubiquitin-like protease family profile domain-containing protein n=2 Tax=Brassica campestris TaxID=3711 RepID=A0A8D9CSM8_BRACM|nr:unnamed protein product [Brassica rapa]